MNNRRWLLAGLLCLASLTAYTKTIDGSALTITAPREERRGSEIYFYSRPQQQDVQLKHNNTLIHAGTMRLDTNSNKISLSGGFYSKYLNNEITGQLLEYNPNNNYLESQAITISTTELFSQAERLSFRGEKITLIRPTIGILMYDFNMKSQRLDLYPGWGVFYDTTFNQGRWPFWYIPVYVVDKRRNAFELPGSFPEWGRTNFSAEYWRWNNHYYVNDKFYGNVQFGHALEKGAGYGFQQILRFSEYDQMTYINQNWQYWPTQETISYEHSFLALPYNEQKKLDFNELLQYNEEIKTADASTLRLTRTVYEESGVDLLNRNLEVEYAANFQLPWQSINLYTANTYTALLEMTTEKEGYRWQSYTELSRDYELPYIASLRPGIGYDTVKYSLYPYSWHRVFSFLNVGRRLWIFRWDVKIYDYVDERGWSPFSFDEHYVLGDNVRTTSSIVFWNIYFGRSLRYLIFNGRIYNNTYFLEYTSRPWTLRLQYNATEESWWGGISAAF